MTRPVVGLVLAALILAYGVRLVWLQDVLGAPIGAELAGFLVLVVLLFKRVIGLRIGGDPVAGADHMVLRPPAAMEIAMASDDDEMSFEEQFELFGGASERPPKMAAWVCISIRPSRRHVPRPRGSGVFPARPRASTGQLMPPVADCTSSRRLTLPR